MIINPLLTYNPITYMNFNDRQPSSQGRGGRGGGERGREGRGGGQRYRSISPERRKIDESDKLEKPQKRKPCVFWLANGFCSAGNACIYSHDLRKQHRQKNEDCHHWKRYGTCSMKNKCSLIHDPKKRGGPEVDEKIDCYNWLKGRCSFDNKCELLHIPEKKGIILKLVNLGILKPKTNYCIRWLKGDCQFNDEVCTYFHDSTVKGILERESKPKILDKKINKDCEEWMNGFCQFTNEACAYVHDPRKKGVVKQIVNSGKEKALQRLEKLIEPAPNPNPNPNPNPQLTQDVMDLNPEFRIINNSNSNIYIKGREIYYDHNEEKYMITNNSYKQIKIPFGSDGVINPSVLNQAGLKPLINEFLNFDIEIWYKMNITDPYYKVLYYYYNVSQKTWCIHYKDENEKNNPSIKMNIFFCNKYNPTIMELTK